MDLENQDLKKISLNWSVEENHEIWSQNKNNDFTVVFV